MCFCTLFTALAVVSAGQTVLAGAISGSESVAFSTRALSATPDGSTNLLNAVQIRLINIRDNGGSGGGNTGNFQDIADGGTGPGVPFQTFLSSASASNPLVLQFKNGVSTFTLGNSTWGTFTALSQTDVLNTNGHTRTETFTGTFTPAQPFFGDFSLTASPASMIFTFSQVGGAGTAVAGNATMAVMPVPEPSTVSMLGTAFGVFGMFAGLRRLRDRESRSLVMARNNPHEAGHSV